MPTVQYQPGNWQVAPSEAQFRAPDLTTGPGYLADGLNHVANVADQIVQLSAQTQARAQALQDSQAVSKVLSNYKTLQGQNAVNAQADTLKQIQDIQTAGQKAMASPMMARMYTDHAGGMFAGAMGEVYGHSVQQVHVAAGQQAQAETAAAQDAASAYYGNPEQLNGALGVIGEKAKTEAQFLGLTDDAAEAHAKQKQGEVIHSAIMAAKANKDYDLANALDLKYQATLPIALRNSVIGEMAPVQTERMASAYYKAFVMHAPDPVQDENRNWVIPAGKGKVADPGNDANPITGTSAGYAMPVNGKVGQTQADHEARGSEGIDIPVPMGTAVKAPAQGTITVGHNDRSGNFVQIHHPDGNVSVLAHLGTVQVKTGDQVNANTVIGAAGMTGDATGPHVHWQVKDAHGNFVDPQTLAGGKVAAMASVSAPGGTIVPNEAYVVKRIDALNIPQAQKDAIMQYAHGQMQDAQIAQNSTYAKAADDAQAWISNWSLAHGNQPPPPDVVPPALWNNMRPGDAAAKKLELATAHDRMMVANTTGQASGFGVNFKQNLDRVLAAQNDPNRISNPIELATYVGPTDAAGLTNTGATALAQLMQGRGTPQGEANASLIRSFVDNTHASMTFSNPAAGINDTKGESAFAKYMAQALPVIIAAQKNGTLGDVLNPQSKNYIGGAAHAYMRDPAKMMQDRLSAMTTAQMPNFNAHSLADALGSLDNNQQRIDAIKAAVSAKRITPQEAGALGEHLGLWHNDLVPRAAPPPHALTGHADANARFIPKF